MEKDNSVAGYTVLHTKNFTLKNTDDEEESIKIEFGDHKAFPVTYAKGDAPVSENQIALSALLAKELGKEVGSTLTLRTGTGGENADGMRYLFRYHKWRKDCEGSF